MQAVSPHFIALVFKTHLDVGFTDFAEKVVEQYCYTYLPQAIETARWLREHDSPDRFIWTTGSWIIYEYLERASRQERAKLEEAIHLGDIVWHGLPFTTHSELLDDSLFTYGLSISQTLDRRFGKQTIAAKMTDVPGHTRGIVPLLAQAGISLLHIGVNPASTVPDVPPTFVWKAPDGSEVMVIYQSGAYGGLTLVPGANTALAFAHTNDNIGPPFVAQVQEIYRQLRSQFPNATIYASTLNTFERELVQLKASLPVVTQEIGDTWIHGVGTDPHKVSQFRELCRLRRQWLGNGQLKNGAINTDRFSNALLLIAEHTWSLDEKVHLADYVHYRNDQLVQLRMQERTQHFEASWQEQRDYIHHALDALGSTAEAVEANQQLKQLLPQPIDPTLFHPVEDWQQLFDTTHFTLAFDERGAISFLRHTETQRLWASEAHPLALFRYESFSATEYEQFWQQYCINKEETAIWSRKDFMKPGIEHAVKTYQIWHPIVSDFRKRHDEQGDEFLLEMRMPWALVNTYGAPAHFSLVIKAPHKEPVLQFTFQWFEKQACRLPEALWLSFSPLITNENGWLLEKLGHWISPLEVVPNGNRKLHAVGRGALYTDEQGQLLLETHDAPLVAPGAPSLLDFNNQHPPMLQGMHVNLFNNVWGTNFPLWYENDANFRFSLHFNPTIDPGN